MENRNFQIMLDKQLSGLTGRPKLLLHSCCAPCSSYVLEYLNKYFDITIFYYNPNIDTKEEFNKRSIEQKRLVSDMGLDVRVVVSSYDPEEFFNSVKGFENEPEGGERCRKCFMLRLDKSAKYAKDNGFHYFTTTLSISPHKNAAVLNEICEELSRKYGIKNLYADFKKKNGYRRSCELSEEYGLYRQNYCGCIYSVNKN